MEQKLLNKKMLTYFQERIKDGVCNIAFVESELVRVANNNEFDKAIAIREALKVLKA